MGDAHWAWRVLNGRKRRFRPGQALTRTVVCMGSDGNAATDGNAGTDAASCAAAKPVATHICAATAACLSYSWAAPEFSAHLAVDVKVIKIPRSVFHWLFSL